MARIGLLAGYGSLPMIFAKKAKEKGDTVIAFGMVGIADKELEQAVDKMNWLEVGDMKKALLLVVTDRIQKVVMLGKVNKSIFFNKIDQFDEEAKKLLGKNIDKKDYPLMQQAAKILKGMGIDVIDSTTYLEELLPSKGILTKRQPAKSELEDIEYARDVARLIARFDVGQTVAVKDKTIIALEGAEGTDETIRRAGGLAKNGFTAVKVARPDQDMRFDVPMVGLDTIKMLIDAGGKAFALESRRMFLTDKEEVIKLADKNGVSIIVL